MAPRMVFFCAIYLNVKNIYAILLKGNVPILVEIDEKGSVLTERLCCFK